jgi:serine/threonine-protein kinase
MSGTPYVFISYSHEDAPTVDRLITDLEHASIRVWIDQHKLIPGTLDWDEAIRDAIQSAQAVILIASPSSRKSRFVRDEIRIAESFNCPFVPFWISGRTWIEAVPLGFGSVQGIDARDSYAAGVQKLIAALRAATPSLPARRQIFLTYYYGAELDQSLAAQIETALVRQGYNPFLDDLAIPMGTRGAQRVRQAIDQCEFFIVLLSDNAVRNEVLRDELAYADESGQRRNSPPAILPIRVQFYQEFPYHLQEYLNPVPWAVWRSPSDTEQVIEDILYVLQGGTLSLSRPEDKARVLLQSSPQALQKPQPYADPRPTRARQSLRSADSNRSSTPPERLPQNLRFMSGGMAMTGWILR